MGKVYLRSLDSASRELLRQRGVSMILKKVKKGDVSLYLGVNKNTVSMWWKAYQSFGTKGLKLKKRKVRFAGVMKLV